MKCKDCKHWGNNQGYNDDKDNRLKSCSCPAMHYGYHVDTEEVKDNHVHIEDDEGWGMTTGPDFGCIHFEPNTSNKPPAALPPIA